MQTNTDSQDFYLGKPLAQYKPRGIGMVLVVMLLALLFLCMGGIVAWGGNRNEALMGWSCLAMGGLIAVMAVIQVIHNLWVKQKTTTVYQQGLTYGHPSEPPVVIRWKELSVFQMRMQQKVFITPASFHMRGAYAFTLMDQGGTIIHIQERYTKASELFETLWRVALQTLMPAAVEAFNDGKTLEFGLLALNRDGIRAAEDYRNWEEIAYIEIRGGVICILTAVAGRREEWVRVYADAVPNLPVFIEMVNRPPIQKLAGKLQLARTSFGL